MRERGVTKAEVEECVLRATSVFGTKGRNRYRAQIGGRKLQIVILADRDNEIEKFVVTVIVEE
jgi:hypothetical protein